MLWADINTHQHWELFNEHCCMHHQQGVHDQEKRRAVRELGTHAQAWKCSCRLCGHVWVHGFKQLVRRERMHTLDCFCCAFIHTVTRSQTQLNATRSAANS